MRGSTPCRYSCRDLRDRDGHPFERCVDSESVESVESVEVVGVVAPGRGRRGKRGKTGKTSKRGKGGKRGKRGKRGKNPSMYTRKGKASKKGSGGSEGSGYGGSEGSGCHCRFCWCHCPMTVHRQVEECREAYERWKKVEYALQEWIPNYDYEYYDNYNYLE